MGEKFQGGVLFYYNNFKNLTFWRAIIIFSKTECVSITAKQCENPHVEVCLFQLEFSCIKDTNEQKSGL